jgi:iron complex outermembrane receptor protein
MRRRIRLTGFFVLGMLAFAGPGRAQDATVIAGQVTTREDGLSLPGATVSIPALNVSAVTDAEGRYSLPIPAGTTSGTIELRITFTGLSPVIQQVRLQPGTVTQDVALGLSFAEQITVGSRAPGADAQQAVPVDVISAASLQSTGLTETMQAIQALAPSFNFPRPTVSDGTDAVRPATLRGLGPDQVLVLVNGKRRHQTALIHINSTIGRGSTGVDLNAIPISAIEKIEILRDGAAAQYGSDAIAGVINIVLKSGVSRPSASLRFGGNVGSFTEVEGAERAFRDGGAVDASGSYGFRLGRGTLSVAAELRDNKGTNRAGFDTRDQVRAGDARNNQVPQPNTHWGDGKQRDLLTFANAEIPLFDTRTASFYAFGGFSRRTSSAGGNFRRALDATAWPSIYPLGFLPLIEPVIIDGSVAAGVRGVQSQWIWDVSGEFGHNRLDYYVTNSLNVSLGPTIPPNHADFYSGAVAFDQFVVNGDLRRPVALGLAGPLNVALGLEVRRERYEIIPGEPDSYRDGGSPNQFGGPPALGAQVFPGFRPANAVNKSRSNVGAYIDTEGDFTRMLRLGFAGRFEHYTDFGNTADGKVSVRFQPDRRFLARGAVSSGFRAPSLGQSHFSTVSTNFIQSGGVFQPVEVGTFPVASPQARVLGATDLTSERSRHYSGGFVLNPTSRFEITMDVYRIGIDDRIVLSDNFTGGRITALLAPLGASGARFFTNAIDTRTTGVDLTAAYRFDLATSGTLRLSSAYNHNETALVRVLPTPPQLIGFENTWFSSIPPNDIEYRRFTCAQPQDSFRLIGEFARGRFGANVRENLYGQYCSLESVDQTHSANWVTDFETYYHAGPATLTFGIQNAFNQFPTKMIPAVAFNNIRTFPRNSPYGFNGRFLYGRISYQF